MKILKKILLAVIFLICLGFIKIYAEDLTVAVEINGIKINSGTIYVAVFNSPDAMRKQMPFRQAIIGDIASQALLEFSVPSGDYVVSVFQDLNENGKLDTNFLGIPREPVGLSNHSGGIPGNFDKLKTRINSEKAYIIVNMVEI